MTNNVDDLNFDENFQVDDFTKEISDDSFDLLDFPTNNLANVDLSNGSFLAHDIFPDVLLLGNRNEIENNLLDFPISNLGDVDLSNESFLADEIFPDASLLNVKNERINSKRKSTAEIFREFSHMNDNQVLMEANDKIIEKQTNAPSNVEKFPMKLHKIVERCEIDGYSDIISWMPHGRSFKIHDRDEFVAKIMPRYFYITKFTSFIRQLTLYGFHKYRTPGADKGSFFHELFLFGRPGLCSGIVRSSTKKRKMESEPNFYKMPCLRRSVHNSDESFVSVPNRPREVEYRNSDTTLPIEKNTSLSKPNNMQGSPSSEYFHKSQQLVAKSLFSTYTQEKKRIKIKMRNHDRTFLYPCAA